MKSLASENYSSFSLLQIRSFVPFVFILCSLAVCETAVAESSLLESVNVKISDNAIEPRNVRLRPGRNIVWRNNSERPVNVRFLSEAVSTTCGSTRGFVLERRGIRESNTMSEGEFVSICLLEPRKYDYEIEVMDTSADGSQRNGHVVAKRLYGTVDLE